MKVLGEVVSVYSTTSEEHCFRAFCVGVLGDILSRKIRTRRPGGVDRTRMIIVSKNCTVQYCAVRYCTVLYSTVHYVASPISFGFSS
jgi:hypothetical protein